MAHALVLAPTSTAAAPASASITCRRRRLLLAASADGQVSECLPRGEAAIPELAEALVAVSRALDAEMSSMPALEVRCNALTAHMLCTMLQHLPLP